MSVQVEYLPFNFNPRPYQAELMHTMLNTDCKRAFICWHRRCGKDLTCWNTLLLKALQRKGNYFYIYPTAKQGRKALWTAIDSQGTGFLDFISPKMIKNKNNTEMRITLCNGSTVQVIGASHYNHAMGTNPVGMVFSEYSLQSPLAYSYLVPASVENKGWIILNTTPRGHNHAYRLFQHAKDNDDWYCDMRTVLDSTDELGQRYITDEQLKMAGGSMSVEKFKQEFFLRLE